MKLMGCIPLLVLVSVISVSCSRLPQSVRSNEELASIRAEYLQNHPDGKYNDHILEGRVVKGMNSLEVLASWGVPNVRRGWEHDKTEYWTYYAKDEHTEQLLSYELIFDDKVLSRWVIGDQVRGLGTAVTEPTTTRTVEETLMLGTASAVGGDATVKKKK